MSGSGCVLGVYLGGGVVCRGVWVVAVFVGVFGIVFVIVLGWWSLWAVWDYA